MRHVKFEGEIAFETALSRCKCLNSGEVLWVTLGNNFYRHFDNSTVQCKFGTTKHDLHPLCLFSPSVFLLSNAESSIRISSPT